MPGSKSNPATGVRELSALGTSDSHADTRRRGQAGQENQRCGPSRHVPQQAAWVVPCSELASRVRFALARTQVIRREKQHQQDDSRNQVSAKLVRR